MKKTKPTKRAIMVMFTMLLLCLGSCKRDPFLPPMPNVLNSYRGTDKMVLQVIEALKAPDNKELLTELEKQGNINWEYKALITSRFLDGITLRFATGINGDYLDAEVDAQTMAVKLYSKQQQEQRDAMAQQAFNKRQAGKSTQAGVCTYNITFEVYPFGGLNIVEILNGITNIRSFISAEGFYINNWALPSLGTQKYSIIYWSTNNETEADIKSKLDDALLAYSQARKLGGRAWFVNNLKTTSSCNAENNNNPQPTVWGVNYYQALNSLNTALWNYNACIEAQYYATSQFDALYQSYMANATSASADIFRTRLSLLVSDVPRIIANSCWNGGVPPGTPVNPGGGGSGGGSFTLEDPGELYELTVVADPIDLAKRFECFNSVPNNAFTIYTAKLYAELPDKDRPAALLTTGFVPGHTFITLTKANGVNTVSQTFGFYPKNHIKASFQVPVKSMVIDNGEHNYHASLVMTVNANQFAAMMDEAINAAKNDYDMTRYNCTNFALDVFNKGRLAPLYIPDVIGSITKRNYGKTPNVVYVAIKNMRANGTAGASVVDGVGTVSKPCY